MNATHRTVLEGHISVEAALTAQSRDIFGIYLGERKRDAGIRSLLRLAQDAGVPVERLPDEEIDQRAQGSTHGGVIAEVGERHFVEMADLVTVEHPSFVVMIDGVEDPFNFGYAVRTLYACGADGLVVRPRNWMSAAATVARASAGASERIATAVAESAEDAAAFFRRRGLLIACTGLENAVDVNAADLTKPLFLLIGGEKRGITRSFMEQADVTLQIPYGRVFRQSLGTAAAAAVLGYEVMRQRREILARSTPSD
jgi:23S rRNA (guanosine2251-2'-O)-methyltransferase